jgi:hypothetical protein
MKKNLLLVPLFVFLLSIYSCGSGDEELNCGTKVVSNVTKQLNLGPEGGCYYINDNNNKSYVERSECNC